MPCRICGCPEARWLTVAAVARQFRCSRKLVRRLLKTGEVDGVMLGGVWRVDHESLDEYVRKDSVRFSVPEDSQRR